MLSIFHRFFGISSLNNQAKGFILKGFSIFYAFIFLVMFTNTFYILFALQFITYQELGIIVGIRFLVQGITDYPTGTIGDWIGQKWVLVMAAFFYAIGYILLSQVVQETAFGALLIAFIVLALADAQQSGAFQAWLDNNYKLYAPEDTNRKIYMEMFAKLQMGIQILMATAFIIGGFIISYLGSRANVFLLQGILFLFLIILFALFIRDHPDIKRSKPNLKGYFSLLKEGMVTTLRIRTLRYILIGVVISSSFMAIWGQLMLFPFYESYGKTDDLIGLLRSAIFLAGAFTTLIIAVNVKRITNTKKWLAISMALSGALFMWGILLVRLISPPHPIDFSFFSYLFVIIVFTIIGIIPSLSNVLMPGFYLEIIPDKNRNSIYSLMPTLIVISSVFTVSFGGYLLEVIGINRTLVILGFFNLVGGLIIGYAILTHKSKTVPKEVQEILEPLPVKDVLAAEDTVRISDNFRQSDIQLVIPMIVKTIMTNK